MLYQASRNRVLEFDADEGSIQAGVLREEEVCRWGQTNKRTQNEHKTNTKRTNELKTNKRKKTNKKRTKTNKKRTNEQIPYLSNLLWVGSSPARDRDRDRDHATIPANTASRAEASSTESIYRERERQSNQIPQNLYIESESKGSPCSSRNRK